MDYKAKYEEALERAKRWADGTLQPERTTPQGVCEAIFPELAESKEVIAHPEKYGLCKPAEWSEEDERMSISILNLLCSHITYVTGNGTTTGKQYPTYASERDWFKKRIKSLRPQPKWKPSEEQMNYLNYGIYVLEEEGYDASASEIKELYEQLKKLMEE